MMVICMWSCQCNLLISSSLALFHIVCCHIKGYAYFTKKSAKPKLIINQKPIQMEEKPLKPILETLFSRLNEPESQKKADLMDQWPEIIGGYFSKHTKPKFIQGGKIAVLVDDSTMAFELSQRYKPTILKRLQNQFGEEKVKDVRFIVGEIR